VVVPTREGDWKYISGPTGADAMPTKCAGAGCHWPWFLTYLFFNTMNSFLQRFNRRLLMSVRQANEANPQKRKRIHSKSFGMN
jgi:hypothetical protein